MANYNTLKTSVVNVIKTNGNNEITGALLQQTLLAMINSIGADYQFVNIATPATNPGTPDQNVFYVAGPGTYPNFGGAIIPEQHIGFLYGSGSSWNVSNIKTSPFSAQSIADGIVQLMDGETPVYPITKSKAVKINNNLTLDDYLNTRQYQNIITTGYWLTQNVAIGDTYNPTPTALAGWARSEKINVEPGEKYNFYGYCGTSSAVKTYVITDSANKVLELGFPSGGTRKAIEIEIPENGAYLFVNFTNQYNAETDYLYANVLKQIPASIYDLPGGEKLGDLSQLKTKSKNTLVAAINDNFDQCSIVNNIPLTVGYYYAMNTAVGQYYNPAPSAVAGFACCKIDVMPGDKFEFYGYGSNASSEAVKLYMVTDENNIILYRETAVGDFKIEPFRFTIPSNGKHLYVNFRAYDSETDKLLWAITAQQFYEKTVADIATIRGQIEYADSLSFQGKNIVCFGDSITEFLGIGNKRYSDWLQEFSKANVVNVGIGGTRISQRATPVVSPSNETQSYAALDLITLIQSVVANDFSIPAAGALWLKNNTADDNTAIVQRLSEIDFSKVDVITILSGTNDWYSGVAMGEIDSNSVSTVYGALNQIITLLSYNFPHIKIFYFSPLMRIIFGASFKGAFNIITSYSIGDIVIREHIVYRFINAHSAGAWNANDVQRVSASDMIENSGDNYTNSQNITLKTFCENVIQQAERNNIPHCNLYSEMWNALNWPNACTVELTHPYAGMENIGRKFFSFLNSHRDF